VNRVFIVRGPTGTGAAGRLHSRIVSPGLATPVPDGERVLTLYAWTWITDPILGVCASQVTNERVTHSDPS
jgi:hypothetical protein